MQAGRTILALGYKLPIYLLYDKHYVLSSYSLADDTGFEPVDPLRGLSFSKRMQSASLPIIHIL